MRTPNLSITLLPDDLANGTLPPALGRGACRVNAAKRSGAPEGLGIEWHDSLERSGGYNLRGGVGMVAEKGRPPACEARAETRTPGRRKGVLFQTVILFGSRHKRAGGLLVSLRIGGVSTRREVCGGQGVRE